MVGDREEAGTSTSAAPALEALYKSPGYTYESRVRAALETVLAQRGLLRARI